ncbi:thiamine phosphate synthase [Defluviitalea phaphyphila]|uniref:thiamine phosphate synthase n=1 Tax=Defluviitalea phaphyphila TaxID=1473580 RepID=UPI000A4A9826|nr:thiamine phosphate synthase [Defluviitalea phaphyphila]
MDKIYRIIDANINRVSEGFRVLEDLSRFYYEDYNLTEKLKNIRHKVRKIISNMDKIIDYRDSINDLGLEISKKSDLDNKKNLNQLITSNFKRVQEGLRVIEESLKIIGEYEISKFYEGFRYESYNLEKIYNNKLKNIKKKKLIDTDIYCITAEEYSNGRDNITVVKEMIKADIKVIQYREKNKNKLQKYKECKIIRKLTKEAGVTFIVNDDIDIALAVEADGIHIGQDDLPIEEARKLVGEKMVIGLSTHSPKQARDAVDRGADYIGVGPIFKTFTKKDVCDPVGLTYLQYAVKNIDIPHVAIGGIKENNISSVVKNGARCIALVSEIVGACDIQEKIKRLRNIIKENKIERENINA